MEEITVLLKDVEKFLTQVLGKLGNLPDDVNKERLELSQRLQKFLNLPNKGATKTRKPPAPLPTQPVKEDIDEVDEGEYGDVASAIQAHDEDLGEETYDDVVKGDAVVEEMYDDVARGPLVDDQENYDDVAAITQTAETGDPEELYDDVSTENTTKPRSSSKMSNSSETLDAKDVTESKKASDIADKVFEGYLDKYKAKGILKKFQRRYCVLTPLALYYYENPKDRKQKGQIILPSSDTTIRKGCSSVPDIKDKKLCFELVNNERCFLFKVVKESELDVWIQHIKAALQTDLSDEQSKLMRQKSMKMSNHDDDDIEDGEDLYECIDTMQQKAPSNSSNDAEPIEEELYELTDQFSQVTETSGSSNEAPVLPSRTKAPSEELEDDEEFEEMEDYQLPDASAPKPGKAKEEEKPPGVVSRQKPPSGSPTLPPRPNSSQDGPHLPPRVPKSTPGSQKPPELPTRTTPPTAKKAPPVLPSRTTPTLQKKTPSTPAEELEPNTAEPEVTPLPPVKAKPKGEQFDYNKVYVALWNCIADDDDDLAFSRGNYLYVREKIPNSDWWVASLMDIPDIRVGLVPRNYIMPAYDM